MVPTRKNGDKPKEGSESTEKWSHQEIRAINQKKGLKSTEKLAPASKNGDKPKERV